MDKIKLKQLVRDEWFDVLNKVLTPEIAFEIDAVREQYIQGKQIYPDPSKVWRAFQECPLDKLRVILLFQDPYFDKPNQATGLAVECGVNISPSYDQILDAFQDCYPTHFNGDIMSGKLDGWAKQGVLLLNTALTVEAGKPNSHKQYWEKFSKKLLTELVGENPNIVIVAFGKQAEEYLKHPLIDDENVIKIVHPAYAARNKIKWDHQYFFHKVNNRLKELNQLEINWDYEQK
jgi:uracil-DNA glycosylase